MPTYQLGVDIAKAKFDCSLRRPDGKFRAKVCQNTAAGFQALLDWLKVLGIAPEDLHTLHVCMEATGIYWEALAEFLANRGATVSVINPAQIKAYGASRLVRTKTDRVDAQLIAQFCYERAPDAWQAPPLVEQTLKALVLRLDALQTMLTQETNRLQVARPILHAQIAAHVEWLNKEIKTLAKTIRDFIDDDNGLKVKRDLLDSIPGIGERTLAILLAYFGTPARFQQARKAAAFVGLDTRQHESGSSVKGKARLSKVGHTFVRKALYMPAIVTLYKTQWGTAFRQRLEHAGKPPKLIIGAMMRKLIHVAFGVLKSGKSFNPKLHEA